ncbi:MAG: acetate--CoA ligase family protein, partial [Actinobacteria bacterium]|nr:acetate--CoA ligase family protein [Actinomycetota bacterium]
HRAALEMVLDGPGVDAVMVVDASPGSLPPEDLSAEVLAASARRRDVTFVSATVGGDRPRRLLDAATGAAVPVFTFPEHAANAIARLASAGEWRATARVYGDEPLAGVDVESARSLVDRWLTDAGSAPLELDHARQEELLAAFGIRVAQRVAVSSLEEALGAADGLGWPVVLKARQRDRRKRSVSSGVALDLAGEGDLCSTWDRMRAALGDEAFLPAIVQRLVEQGTDVAMRARRSDGVTTVEVGLGGPAARFDPWELGVVPLTLADAGALVAASSVGRALTDPIDRVPVTSLLHRIAAMVESVEGIRSVRADPVIVSGPDAWITDVVVTIGGPDGAPPVRHLG